MTLRQSRRMFGQIQQCIAPKGSLLEKHGASTKGGVSYVDCFQVKRQRETMSDTSQSQQEAPTVRSFAASFFSCNAFYLESWVLWSASKLNLVPPPFSKRSDINNNNNYDDDAFGSGFFRVLEETNHELLLDSGATQTWMKVERTDDGGTISYQFGSIVKQLPAVVQWTIPLHCVYAKVLLVSAIENSEAHQRKQQD